ncbi:MAG: sel1 repeat family protein [Campylobacterales bacterium]|nr:sel1 repeat family protein [Campylobacterales bacterium]
MKKLVSLYLLVIITFTSCTHIHTPKIKKNTKSHLLHRAKQLDINAIEKLNQIYLFPKTKEGFEFFKILYKDILQSSNPSKILAFAKIYKDHYNMFINGKEKYVKLLERAYKLGEKDAFDKIVNFYLDNSFYKKQSQLLKEVLKSQDLYKISTLYKALTLHYSFKKQKELESLMIEKNLPLGAYPEYKKLSKIFYDENKKEQTEKLLEVILNSNDYKLIEKVSSLVMFSANSHEKFLNKLIQLDKRDINIYLRLANTYNKLYKDNKTKQIEILKKASLLDSYEATTRLIKIYLGDRKYINEYSSFKQQILKLNESKRALANFLYRYIDKQRGINLLKGLAQKGNAKAMIDLATLNRKNSGYYNPQEIKTINKWQNFILKSEKPYLRSLLRKKLQTNYGLKEEYSTLLRELEEKESSENNIYTLRDLKYKYVYKNKELSDAYMQKAMKLGDTRSTLDMAAREYYTKDVERVKKGIAIYEELAKKGELTAIKTLAEFYITPSFRSKKLIHLKDPKKAAKYYEKLFQAGDTEVISELVYLYLCGGKCYQKGKPFDEKRAQFFIEKLIEQKDKKEVDYIAWKYYKGSHFKKDIQKAIYLYEEIGKMGYPIYYGRIGHIYFQDLKDNKKALEYFRYGSEKGSMEAKSWIGYFYYKGIEVEKNINKAQEYFKQSQEIPYSIFQLANIFKNKKQYKDAIKYYKKILSLPENPYKKQSEKELKILQKEKKQ